jgi:hypothetical protein
VKRALEPMHVASSTPITGLPTSRVVGKGEITAVSQPPGTTRPPGFTPPSGTPYPGTYPPNTPAPFGGTYPPNTPAPYPMQPPPYAPPPAASSGGSRVLVIAIVAIVLSAIGVAVLLFAT